VLCVQAAKKSEDVGAEGKACYRLGSAYIKAKSNYDVAIKYLLQYVRHTPACTQTLLPAPRLVQGHSASCPPLSADLV
jgi:hypothetical protein